MYAYLRHDFRMAGYGWLNPYFTKSINDGFWDEFNRINLGFADFLKEEKREFKKVSENELFEVMG